MVDLFEELPHSGVLVTNDPEEVGSLDVVRGSHPYPDEQSEIAGRRVLAAAARVGPSDLAIVLISGGGSALLAVPAQGIEMSDLRETNSVLIRSGATIGELNTVRKHLSVVKGGQLAAALSAAGGLVTLVLSDVIGSPFEVIASGPTVPDPTTYEDALEVLDRYALRATVPESVLTHLVAGAAGDHSETPEGGSVFDRQVIELVGDGVVAAEAAAAAAREEGWEPTIVSTQLEGESRDVARLLISDAGDAQEGELRIYAGETTVTVAGDGLGGRNQELALAASIELAGRNDLCVLALGTDGIDGPTPAAGAFGDGSAVARGASIALDAEDHLRRNDSHRFLMAVGDAVITGPTGTNVGDLVLVCKANASGDSDE